MLFRRAPFLERPESCFQDPPNKKRKSILISRSIRCFSFYPTRGWKPNRKPASSLSADELIAAWIISLDVHYRFLSRKGLLRGGAYRGITDDRYLSDWFSSWKRTTRIKARQDLHGARTRFLARLPETRFVVLCGSFERTNKKYASYLYFYLCFLQMNLEILFSILFFNETYENYVLLRSCFSDWLCIQVWLQKFLYKDFS